MTNFPNLEFPISSADCAAIEAIFIELMRARDGAAPDDVANSVLQFRDPPSNEQDLRLDWGM
jgi:hypothetical protein